MTLFASIFFFVNTFPRPPSQPSSQFQASLVYGGTAGTSIVGLNIVHLAGPTLTGPSVLFYLYSAAHPSAFPTPYTLANGLAGSSIWSLGQTWSLDLTTKGLSIPDNITISIATSSQLLFRTTLPGANPNIPPEFMNSGTTPASPAIGQAFTIYTQIIDDDLNSHSVYVNVSQLPGVTGTLVKPVQMTYSASNGLWTYAVAAGTTTASGTYYVFVNATDLIKQANSMAIPVVIASGSVVQANVQLSASPATPVRGSAVTLSALVTNPGNQGGSVNVTFSSAGTTLQVVAGYIGAGASASFTYVWTPSTAGTYLLSAVANISRGGAVSGTLNITVFPKILFIATNVPAGTTPKVNDSARFAAHLTADGIPFSQQFVSCTASSTLVTLLGTASSWDTLIIDFGSGSSGTCVTPASTVQSAIVTAGSSDSIWIMGSDAWTSTTCSTTYYSQAYLNLFGVGFAAGKTCTVAQTAPATLTWTPASGSGLRADGIGAMSLNGSIASSSAFYPGYTFSQSNSAGGNTFLSIGTAPLGVFRTSGTHRYVALGTTGELIADKMPNAAFWVSGNSSSVVTYNVMGYLCGFATSSSPGRALQDFAIGGTTIAGTNHASLTNIYAAVRSNGPVSGVITATLYVNGTEAFYQGVPVTVTVSVPANGATVYLTLVWKAPGAASYTLSVGIVSTPNDLYAPNNLVPLSFSGQQIAFV